ncbi:TonB-dependent receptor [Sphingomonas oligophenolica]|uniref:TonB-dependent receptor n=1 Tax=Sphingomonas oligophenolica TaxID=301154 RepID=A0ABU9Y9T5_9SPHN
MKKASSILLKTSALAAIAVAVAPSAWAQDAVAKDQANDAPNEAKVEDIVVTAQFRRQNLQETPIAITAVSGAMMEARSQVTIADVAAQAPSVTLKPNSANHGSSLAANIRGVGQFDFHPALEPGVGVYVDDVYYSTLTGSILDLLDLDRVEILRGPQGTLAGKNSIGGAIKLYSKRPTGDNSGYGSITLGSRNRVDLRGAVDLGLAPDLSLRVTGVSRSQDGYISRLDYGCVHPGQGIPALRDAPDCLLSKQGEVGYWATRGNLRYVPSSNLEINIIGDYTHEKHEIAGGVLTYAKYTGAGDVNPFPTPIPYDSRFICGRYCNYSSYVSPADGALGESSIPGKLFYTGWGVSGQIEWKIADGLRLVGITAYRKYNETFSNEDDLSPMAVTLGGPNNVDFHAWSNELRLTGDAFGKLHYTIGGYMIDQRSFYVSRQDIRYANPALVFVSGDPVPAHSRAVFAHAAYDLTESLIVTGGIRYTKEDKNYTFRRRDRYGNLLGGQYTALDGKTGNYSGDNIDYRANIAYKITGNINAYAQYSTGFKGGGVNPRPYSASQVQSFNPEKLATWEIGLKSDLFDRRVRLNLAAYTSRYKDIQLTLNSCPQFNPVGVATFPCAMPANVGTARIRGFEAETSVRLVEGMMFDAALSHTDFRYTYIAPQAGGATNPNGVQYGMMPPYTPRWKWSAGLQYEISTGKIGSLTPRIDVAYQSTAWGAAVNSARTEIAGYTLANARLTWRNHRRDLEASFEVTNLFNKYYYLTTSEISVTTGVANAQPGRPREWGVTLKKNF